MSRTAIRRHWRQEKRQQELPLPEVQPMPAVNPDEGECCGGYCGESSGEEITTILLKACPAPEDIANVFYGYTDGLTVAWVDAHMQECANCQQVVENLILLDSDFVGA